MNFLSIDIGTTRCKCQLFSEDGSILLFLRENYPLLTRDGETYVDLNAIVSHVRQMMAKAARHARVDSVCISSFGEAFVLLDGRDEVLFPPMLYTDPRGKEEAEALLARFGAQRLFARNGVLPQSMFSLSKLLWLKAHEPALFSRAEKAMLICDYLGYLLTGERVIDCALASRTGAFLVDEGCFDRELLSALGISPSLFSVAQRAGSTVGRIRPAVCEELGLPKECRLVLGSHDQVCAALGAGVVRAGDAVNGMGTVECITALFPKREADVRMGLDGYPRVPYPVEGLYCTYLFNYAGGALLNWMRDRLLHGYSGGEEDFFAYMERAMGTSPTGILTLPYFAGAATPYQDIHAKGAILNLRTSTTDADIYRSLLEGNAMEMRLNAERVRRYGIRIRSAAATGGGSASEKWLALKADIQNIPLRTLRSEEGGLCGCAMLQAVATGCAAHLAQAAEIFVQYEREYLPDAARHAAYEQQYQKYRRLYRAVKEFY